MEKIDTMNPFVPPLIESAGVLCNYVNPQNPLSLGTVVNAELIIGKLSANCKGNGICKMLPVGSYDMKCSAIRSTLLKRSDDKIGVLLYTRHCCEGLKRRLFARQTFLMEEPFYLPKWIREGLSLKQEKLIPAGSYPILKLKECACVSFTLHGY